MYTGAASQQQHTFYDMAVMGGRPQAEDERAHHHIDTHNSAIFELFRTFLRKPEPKSLLLNWLGALVKEHACECLWFLNFAFSPYHVFQRCSTIEESLKLKKTSKKLMCVCVNRVNKILGLLKILACSWLELPPLWEAAIDIPPPSRRIYGAVRRLLSSGRPNVRGHVELCYS